MLEIPDIPSFTLAVMLAAYGLGALAPVFTGILKLFFRTSGAALDRGMKNVGIFAALLASLAGCALALSVLLPDQPVRFDIPQTLPFGPMMLQVDGLSAFFLGVISLLVVAASIYSFGYMTEFLQRRNIALLVALFNVFPLSMVCVVLAGHAVFFLFVWEIMSLTTFFLISYEHEDPASRRAAFVYIVMTHIGTAFLVVMFIILYTATGSFSFAAFRDAGSHVSALAKSAIFICATIGFGTKAGVIPFHIWLPEAHPAAPSNISALMSGVMIKTGIYGMVRVYFDFLGPVIPGWWGPAILLLAVTSSVLGVLYALMEHDLKRLLAFHSIENIGIILMGIGAALLFSSHGRPSLAVVALVAALYHVLNHATFKGLLFFGAGSILHATHSRNIEELGGLIRKMPWTSFFFLIGAAAISALPPLNGFVSEWLTFQALLLGFPISDLAVKIAIPLTVALLALTGALAAACFVKAFGISFLGIARSEQADHAHESPFTMVAAMGLLALFCVLFGVAPGLLLSLLQPVAHAVLGTIPSTGMLSGHSLVVIPESTSTSIAPSVLIALLIALTLIPVAAVLLAGRSARSRLAPTWACGLQRIEPHMQYTATGFSKPIRLIFSTVYRATHEIETSGEASPYFRPDITYELRTESVFLKYLYEPVIRFVVASARLFRRIQTGHIQSYLAYIFITLVLLLLFAS
jgi:hydrogenase-4 component B